MKYCGKWNLEGENYVIRDVGGKELAFITSDAKFVFGKHAVYVALLNKSIFSNVLPGLQMYVDPKYAHPSDEFTSVEQAKKTLEEILVAAEDYTIITDERLLNIS